MKLDLDFNCIKQQAFRGFLSAISAREHSQSTFIGNILAVVIFAISVFVEQVLRISPLRQGEGGGTENTKIASGVCRLEKKKSYGSIAFSPPPFTPLLINTHL